MSRAAASEPALQHLLRLDLEQIAHMDWLCDAVDGHIPEYDELAEVSKPMYRMQGIHRDLLPVEKEAEL